jgi:dephospho-CoA kinase
MTENKPTVFGLTGRVGVGKSVVQNYIANATEFVMLDLDKIGHMLLETPQVIQALTQTFGSDINKHGQIDRKALGEIVFHNTSQRLLLNKLIHPLIKAEVELSLSKANSIYMLCGALLKEINLLELCNEIIVIDASDELIRQNIGKKFDLISPSQLTRETYLAMATHKITNQYNAYIEVEIHKVLRVISDKYSLGLHVKFSAADHLNTAKKEEEKALSTQSQTAFESAVKYAYFSFYIRPQDLSSRDFLQQLWANIDSLLCNNAMFELPPIIKMKKDHVPMNGRLKSLRLVTSLRDFIMENAWRKQCARKFGGAKPHLQSWKQWYLSNESAIETRPNPLDRVYWSLNQGHFHYLKYLLSEFNIDPNDIVDLPMNHVILNSDIKSLAILLSFGLDANRPIDDGMSLLHFAVIVYNPSAINLLLKYRANPLQADEQGLSSLQWALYLNQTDTAYTFVSYSHPVCVRQDIVQIVKHDNHAVLAKIMDLQDTVPLKGYLLGYNLLHIACYYNAADCLEYLIKKQVMSIHSTDRFNRTPLHWAVLMSAQNCISILMEHGANAQLEDLYQETAYSIAGFSKEPSVLPRLMAYGYR